MAFDMQGLAYLRTADVVGRFDARTWREVPFDYGEELEQVTTHGVGKKDLASAITFSGGFESSSQLGGMGVSPKGHLLVTVVNPARTSVRTDAKNVHTRSTKSYTPQVYPGRARPWEIHVWNKRGKLLYEDAMPGVGRPVGVNMDADDYIYAVVAGVGRVKGTLHFNPISCSMIKLKPRVKTYGTKAVIPMPSEKRPKRPPDVKRVDHAGDIWVEKAQWILGGVGFDGKRVGCHCPSQSRPALDYFARSFMPEVDRYGVLVVDSNGNEILRVGRYGNVDDGMPLIREGGPPGPRSIGGDEVGIMHAQMLAVHTDHRLFIGDLGNARVAAVKLDYDVTERIALGEVAERNSPE
jgi:hypothetical protein